MDQAQRLDELILAAEERGYGKGYEKGRIDGALEATRSMEPADKAQAAYGLFGPGIFATGIDLAALDEGTAWRLGLWCGEQVKATEERGYERGKAEALNGWASLPENVRMLITDASIELQRCAENDIETERFMHVWQQHRMAVLQGRFGRYALKADGSGVDTGGAS